MKINKSKERLIEIEIGVRELFGKISPKDIAMELGVCVKTVHNYAKKIGFRPITVQESRALFTTAVNINYFKTWCPNMAYILGYTWADGHIRGTDEKPLLLVYRCVAEDRIIIEGIKRELKSTHEIKDIPPIWDERGFWTSPAVSFIPCSYYLAKSLVDLHGIKPRKSERDLPMSQIPEEFLPHFARGVLDGDGTVTQEKYNKFGWYGTNIFIKTLQQRISSAVNIPIYKIHELKGKSGNLLYGISWGAIEDVKKLHRWIYPEGDYIFLPRKRNIINI